MRDMQVRRRRREIPVPGGGFKRANSIQRR
jgi:hypothetical protein